MNMNMCSNNGSSSACACCGGGGGGGGNDHHGVTMWSSSGLKKQHQPQQKRPRIPKRGPGVAELEKILREQESSDITSTDRGNNEGFSVSSSCLIPHYSSSSSSCLKSHPPPPPRPISNSFPSAPKFDHVVPPTIGSMYGNTNTHSLGRNVGGRSGDHELFPMDLTSCKSKPNLNEVGDGSQSDSGSSPSRNLSSESNHANWNYPANIQKRNNGYAPQSMMNQFHGNGGNHATSGSLSIGLHNHLESPSIQNSFYNFTSRSHDEPKMAGMKRSHTSSLDNSLIPPSNFQVLPSFSRYNRPQQSSTNESHGASSYKPTTECYRDAKWGSSLELSNKRFNSENGGSGHANFPPFVSPEVPPPPAPMHLFQNVLSKGNMFPRQVIEDKRESSSQRSESNGQDHKPFFNFLEVKGQAEVTDATCGSNHGGHEGGRGGLDLSLKL